VGVQLVSPRRTALSRLPEVFPPAAAGAAALLAVLSLIGWQFRIASLREPLGGFMAPNASLCIICLAAAIILYRWRDREWAYTTSTVLESFVVLLCAVVLFEHLTEVDTGLLQVFFSHRLADWN